MSAARLILRLVFGTVAALLVGTILVIGFTQVIEPFSQNFSAPAGLGWGSPGATVLTWAAIAGIGLLLFLIIWLVAAPIRRDRRQQFGR